MVQRKLFARALSVVMSVSLCLPALATEATLAKIKSAPRTALEVQLGANGSIRGKVVDRQGKALPNTEVKVANKIGSAVTKTDASGAFAVTGLRVGEYVIGIGNQTQKVRVWNAQTAPPRTATAALLVVGGTVRAQCGDSCGGCSSCASSSCSSPCATSAPACGPSCGGCNSCNKGLFGCNGSLGARPLLIGAGVAAAIAIPLAIDDDDDDAS